MQMDSLQRLLPLALLALLLAATGCSTTAMKGTPFFTGEYGGREGAVENRVNLWPLLYYREPALSALWPLGEFSDDRLALRPIFSIKNRDQPHPTYNLLWPLGSFNTESHNYRLFPFFWGDDYQVAFPLYWHFTEPEKGESSGVNALFPLWLHYRRRDDYSLHLLWPIFNIKSYRERYPSQKTDDEDACGWRLWPLAGSYHTPDRSVGSSFALWPLGRHSWDDTTEKKSWMLLPLFYRAQDSYSSSFYSLLVGWERDKEGQHLDWQIPPLLAWGHKTQHLSETRALLGLYGRDRSPTRKLHYLLPLFYQEGDADAHFTLSPLYCSRSSNHTAQDGWWAIPPLLLLRNYGPQHHNFYSLLYSHGENQETERKWLALMPLYYRSRSPAGESFITILGGWHRDEESHRWIVYPLLSGGKSHADGGEFWLGGPLCHAKWDSHGSLHWLFPLYYRNSYNDSLLSPLYCRWRESEQYQAWLIPPLLSFHSRQPQRSDLWLLAGLGHFSSGTAAGSNYLLPLYYRDKHRLLTPLYGHFKSGATCSRYWLTPLVGTHSGYENGSWLFPLYNYRHDRERQKRSATFLLFGDLVRSPRYNSTTYPLLFSHTSRRYDSPDTTLLAEQRSWELDILLLFAMERSERLVTTFRAGIHQKESLQQADTNSLPEATNSVELREAVRRRSTRLFPIWRTEQSEGVDAGWLRSEGHLLLILYDYKHEVGSGLFKARSEYDYLRRRVLFRLYHYERLNGVTSTDIFPAITIDRNPVAGKYKVSFLWRLFRYERTPEKLDIDLLFIPLRRKHATTD